jgi:hypothetical protein
VNGLNQNPSSGRFWCLRETESRRGWRRTEEEGEEKACKSREKRVAYDEMNRVVEWISRIHHI